MDVIEIIQVLADSSISLVLALVVIYWNRKDMKEYADREREDKLLVVKALQDNTSALAGVKMLLERLNGK
jgi:hypothetical protein